VVAITALIWHAAVSFMAIYGITITGILVSNVDIQVDYIILPWIIIELVLGIILSILSAICLAGLSNRKHAQIRPYLIGTIMAFILNIIKVIGLITIGFKYVTIGGGIAALILGPLILCFQYYTWLVVKSEYHNIKEGVDPNGQGGIVYSTPGGQTGVPNPNFSVGQQMAPGQQQPGSVVYVSPHQQNTTVYGGGHQGGIIYSQGPQQQPEYGV